MGLGFFQSEVDISYNSTNSGPLAASTYPVYSLGPNVNILENGFIGIGVTTPTYALQLGGSKQAYFGGGAFTNGLSFLNYSGGSNSTFASGFTSPAGLAFEFFW